MGYSVTAALQRGHSENITVSLDLLMGVTRNNALGVRYPLPPGGYWNKELVEVRVMNDGILKGKGIPTLAELSQVLLCLSTPDGYRFCADMPLSRLTYPAPGGRLLRNLFWSPRLVDLQQSYVYTVGTILRKPLNIEFIYKQ